MAFGICPLEQLSFVGAHASAFGSEVVDGVRILGSTRGERSEFMEWYDNSIRLIFSVSALGTPISFRSSNNNPSPMEISSVL